MQPLNELQCYWRTSRIVQIKNVERAEQEANCCQRIFDVVYNNDAIDCQHEGIRYKSRRPYTFEKNKKCIHQCRKRRWMPRSSPRAPIYLHAKYSFLNIQFTILQPSGSVFNRLLCMVQWLLLLVLYMSILIVNWNCTKKSKLIITRYVYTNWHRNDVITPSSNGINYIFTLNDYAGRVGDSDEFSNNKLHSWQDPFACWFGSY